MSCLLPSAPLWGPWSPVVGCPAGGPRCWSVLPAVGRASWRMPVSRRPAAAAWRRGRAPGHACGSGSSARVAPRSARSSVIAASKSSRRRRPVDRRRSAGRPPRRARAAAQDGQADLVGGDLGAARRPDRLLDPLGEPRQVVLGDRAALAGLADTDDDLVAAERLGGPGALDDRQARRLDGREPPPHSGHCRRRRMAVPSSVVARVHDAGVGVPAERAVHGGPSSRCRSWPSAIPSARPVDESVVDTVGQPVGNRAHVHNMWTNYNGVTTRCSGHLVPL